MMMVVMERKTVWKLVLPANGTTGRVTMCKMLFANMLVIYLYFISHKTSFQISDLFYSRYLTNT